MILDWVREAPRSRRDVARDALAWRSSRPAFVLAIVAALFAVAVGLLTATPALATTPGSTYDTAVYAYDAPALLSSSDTAASYVRGAPSGPVAMPWARPASVRDRGVAANTAVPIAEGNAAHIFRSASGHLAQDTLANRALLQATVSPGNLVRTQSLGSNGVLRTFQRTLPNGDVVWVEVRNGSAITNGGVNVAPPGP